MKNLVGALVSGESPESRRVYCVWELSVTSSSSLHDVERPPPDEDIHTLVPGLVQSEPRHAGGQQTHHSHGGAAELTCRGVAK